MPELPDVEVYRRRIEAGALRRRFERVEVLDSAVLDGVSAQTLGRRLKGRRFEEARRHGKSLFVLLDSGGWVTMHFGMTGDAALWAPDGEPPRFACVNFHFDAGGALAFVNQRKLGRIGLTDDPQAYIEKHDLGPDALALSEDEFLDLLRDRRGGVKSALLDQSLMAGLGNVYSDEVLYRAKIHSNVKVQDLDEKDLRRLHRAIRKVIEKTIEFNADPSKAPRTFLLAHREKGGTCPRCGTAVETIRASGRTSWLCPKCQPSPRR